MIEIKNLNCYYDGFHALKDVNLNIRKGGMLGIIGPNGAGKSTFIKCILNLLSYSGEIFIDGVKILSEKKMATKIAYFPSETKPLYDYSVYEIVSMGRTPHIGIFGNISGEDRLIVEECMRQTEVYHLKDRKIGSLSSGERQLAFLAQVLAQQTDAIILDEPATHLDINHQIKIFETLKRLNSERKITVISVNHDINLTSYYFSEILAIKNGRVFLLGKPEDVVTEKNLKEIYDIKDAGIFVTDKINGKPQYYLSKSNFDYRNQT